MPNNPATPTTTTTPTPRPEWLDRAEATKLEAEAEAARAQAGLHEQTARKFAAEADLAGLLASKGRIELDREEHKRRKELAGDEFHRTYLFDKSVDDSSVKACIRQLSDWERTVDGEELTVNLVVNSPGGGIFEGFALIDFIEGMHSRGHTVNTHAYGMAASMGGVLLQIGKTRKMGPSAALLIHEAQFRAGGKTGAVEDEVLLVHMLQDRILDIYAERAKTSVSAHPMSRATIKTKWNRRDWWISAPDCLKHGFIDEIA